MRLLLILFLTYLLPAALHAGVKVGSMNIKGEGILDTDNYIAGLKGIKICDEFTELNNVFIRGELSATTMKYNEVSAIGGELIVAPATTLVVDAGDIIVFGGDYVLHNGDYLAESATNIGCRDRVFGIGEIVLLKTVAEGTEYMRIKDTGTYTSISTDTVPSGYYYIYEVDRDLDGSGADSFLHGTAIVSTGKTGGGYIVHDADGPNTPRTDYIVRDGTDTYNNISRKAVIGNLGVVNSPVFGQLSGYGFWSDNLYAEGTINIKAGGDLVYASTQACVRILGPADFVAKYSTNVINYGDIIKPVISGSTITLYAQLDVPTKAQYIRLGLQWYGAPGGRAVCKLQKGVGNATHATVATIVGDTVNTGYKTDITTTFVEPIVSHLMFNYYVEVQIYDDDDPSDVGLLWVYLIYGVQRPLSLTY